MGVSAAPHCEGPCSPAQSSPAGESSPGEPCRSQARPPNPCSKRHVLWQLRAPQNLWFPTQIAGGGPIAVSALPAAVWELQQPAASLLLCKVLLLQICPVGKGFPSTGTNLFYLLPAPNSPQTCRLRSAPDLARTSTAISPSVLLLAIEIKLIRKGKGKKDLSVCLALTRSGWKGTGLE